MTYSPSRIHRRRLRSSRSGCQLSFGVSHRRLTFESLERRVVLTADLAISELVANNDDGLIDYYDQTSDWFEVHNRGTSSVDLRGWHFTDDLGNPTKWTVPQATVVGPDERLVVFASNRDLVAPNGELHTSFGLASSGEAVGLADPSGQLVDGFVFPALAEDVSFGSDEDIQITPLITAQDAVLAVVPTGPGLGDTWTGGNEPFNDNSWMAGTGAVGYEAGQVEAAVGTPVAYWAFDELLLGGSITPDALGRYDGTVSGATVTTGQQGKWGEALSFDGDGDYVLPGVISEVSNAASFTISLWFRRAVDHHGTNSDTNHLVNNVLIAQSSSIDNDNLEIGTEGNAVEVYLDTVEYGGPATTVNQPASLQNNTWHHLVVSYESGVTNELKIYVDGTLASQHSEYGGLLEDSGLSPFAIGLARPGGSEVGDFEGLIDEVAVWDIALESSHVAALFNGTNPPLLSGYDHLIGLDLTSDLQHNNASAYIRIPFSTTGVDSFDLFRLRMQYDDAFVASINGVEVARAGVIGQVQWDSAADADRPDFAALTVDEFFIANQPGLLVNAPSQNILAIQLLNFDPSAIRALAHPELDAIQSQRIQVLTSEALSVTAFVPADNVLLDSWTGGNEPFDDAAWWSGQSGVGFDLGPGGPAAGPVAYWPFDTLNDGGAVAPDVVGNYDGTVSGATLTSGGQGVYGEALAFDGDNDYVLPGLITELVDAAEFAVSLWFRRTVDHAGSAAETNHLVNNVLIAQSADGSNDNLEIGTEGEAVEVYLDTVEFGGPASTVSQPASIQDNSWHHLVMSYDSGDTSELKLYVDGELVSSYEEYGGLLDHATSSFSIGVSRPLSNSWGGYEGLIDDVAVWNASLGPQQVAALFGGTSPLLLSGFDDLIGLDLETQLAGQNSSAFTRFRFGVDDPNTIVSMNLKLRVDDAAVAYLNGTEVARTNFTGIPQFDSTADSDLVDTSSLTPVEFFIANQPDLLRAGTNILAIQVLNASTGADRLLVAPELEMVTAPYHALTYMETPTPGAVNGADFTAVASPAIFSRPSGTFTTDFSLILTTSEPDSEIRYTVDGSVPTATSLLYTSPIDITSSIQIRTRVYLAGYISSETVSETYLRLAADVQDFTSDLPIVVVDNLGAGAIPTYNPKQPVFMGIFEPDSSGRSSLTNTPDIATRAGFRSRGSSSQLAPKKSYRIETWNEENDDDNITPFGMPSESDWLLLGPYFYDRAMFRNDLMYELSNQMGRYAARTQFVEVYANSNGGDLSSNDFVGLYSFTESIKRGSDRVDIERMYPNATAEPDIDGGYIIVIDALCWVSCPPQQTEVYFQSSRGLPSNDSFYVHNYPGKDAITLDQRIYVENYIEAFEDALYGPNFTDPDLGYAAFIDVDSFVDGHWLGQIAKNEDNLVHSTYFHKPRGEKLIMGPTWDYDQSMADSAVKPAEQARKSPEDWHRFTYFDWWGRLFQDLDFEQKWIDRYQELRQNQFSPENIHSVIDGMADQIREAQARNAQVWSGVPPQGGNWQVGEVDRLKQWYIDRIAWIDTQFVAQPTLSLPSSHVVTGQALTITAPVGSAYYTTDGSDPRAAGGGISPTAVLATSPLTLNASTHVIARTFENGKWSGPHEAFFVVESPAELMITEINYNPADPTAAELAINPLLNNDDFEFVEVQNVGTSLANLNNYAITDGVQFSFPDVQLAPGQFGVVVKDVSAFQLRYGTPANILGVFDSGNLRNAGENLTLLDFAGNTIANFIYGDDDPWPETPDGFGATLELIDPVNVPLDDLGSFIHWRGSTEFGGTPGAAGSGPLGIVVQEVLANTDGVQPDAIELLNASSVPVDISGWYLSDSANDFFKYQIPTLPELQPGTTVVFDEDDFNSSGGPGDFALSGSLGDAVWVVVGNGVGGVLSFVDEIHFPASLAGESFGRHPGGLREVIPNQQVTLGAVNTDPRVGPLVISEVMYHPPDPVDGTDAELLEFLEIYNPTHTTVSLADWVLAGVGYEFASGTAIGPGEFVTLLPFDPVVDLESIARFETTYQVDIPDSGQATSRHFFGPYVGRLANDGERLTLFRADESPPETPSIIPLVIEDRLDFDDVAPWSTTADGGGQSLHRQGTHLWAGDASHWISGRPSPGSFGPGIHAVASNQIVIGEVGNELGVTHVPQVVSLDHTFANPVVFVQLLTFHGTDQVAVRVSDVQSDQFTVALTEPSDLNGIHGVGETVSYLVLEAGNHILSDGTKLEVGAFATSATVGKRIANQWETVAFTTPFATTPVILSHIQTDNTLPFVKTRHRQLTSTDFLLGIEPEEAYTTQLGVETVGYLAVESGTGTWDGMAFEALTTSANVSHAWTSVGFSQAYGSPPHVFASFASFNDQDNAALRGQNTTNTNVSIKVEEDTSFDEEVTRSSGESLNYLAIGGPRLLHASTASLVGATAFSVDVMEPGRVGDINVALNISHSHTSDLVVQLESPSGTIVELFSGVGGDGDDFSSTILDDQASQSISSGNAPFMGHFEPSGSLAAFRGEVAMGMWTLHITDTDPVSHAGFLTTWSLDIQLAPELEGNVDFDDGLDTNDIDLIFANEGSKDVIYDLDSDGETGHQDVDILVKNLMGSRYGDTDLDQDVDVVDFNHFVSGFNPLGTGGDLSWSKGNFDGDGDIDVRDFNVLVKNFAPLGFSPIVGDASSEERGVNLNLNAMDKVTDWPSLRLMKDEPSISTTYVEKDALPPEEADVVVARSGTAGGFDQTADEDLLVDWFKPRSKRARTSSPEDS